jgi:hypothetical protein
MPSFWHFDGLRRAHEHEKFSRRCKKHGVHPDRIAAAGLAAGAAPVSPKSLALAVESAGLCRM